MSYVQIFKIYGTIYHSIRYLNILSGYCTRQFYHPCRSELENFKTYELEILA